MKCSKKFSVEELQIVTRFDYLRTVLSAPEYSAHLEKPLAYWALPTDRRLPIAFLTRRLGDLLQTPLEELAATPGIGRKKMATFIQLLARAAATDRKSLPGKAATIVDDSNKPLDGNGCQPVFDAGEVSELQWEQWRQSVVRHGLEAEPLGRFAPSLQRLTKVVWNTPLGHFTDVSLAELRSRKTYGHKRVRAILEVFHAVYSLIGQMAQPEHLTVRIVPRFIDRAEQWVQMALSSGDALTARQLRQNYVEPLLEQVRIDAPQTIVVLAEGRLGINGQVLSVRQVARAAGLTRARVYQLFDEVSDILAVRWPTGYYQSRMLRDKVLSQASGNLEPFRQFLAAVEMFYPGPRRANVLAAGHKRRPACARIAHQVASDDQTVPQGQSGRYGQQPQGANGQEHHPPTHTGQTELVGVSAVEAASALEDAMAQFEPTAALEGTIAEERE